MNFINNIYFLVKEDKKEFIKVILLYMLHSFFLSIPSGILVFVILEVMKKNPNLANIYLSIGVMAVMLVFQLFIARKTHVASATLTYVLSEKLRIKLGNHLYNLSLGVFSQKDPSYYSSLLLQDIRLVENAFSHGVPNVISGFFSVIFLFVFLFFINVKLAFILFLGIVGLFPFMLGASYFMQKFGALHVEKRGEMSERFLEFCEGMRFLKSFNATKSNFKKLNKTFLDFKKLSILVEMVPGPLIFLSFIVCELAFFTMLYFGLDYIKGGALSVEYFVIFLIIGYRTYEPVKSFMIEFLGLKYMNSSLNRVMEVMKLPTLKAKSSHVKIKSHEIKFENVSFAYENKTILENLSLDFKANSITALVGYSGEGKSTILNLISRFWDTQSGKISIGGVDIKDLPLNELYDLISEVFQDVYLFDDSIYNNVKIANPNASEAEILESLQKANCMDFINQHKEGIHAKVGEGGTKLSGGEKQRISIARALLKNSPIILLDEATASLDPENEHNIQKAIYELVQNKTVIVIAHKLSTIKDADKIYVINNKNIAESGTNKELLALGGIYAKMWEYQKEAMGAIVVCS